MARVLLALFAFGIMLVAAAAEADADRKLLAPAPKPKVTNVPKVIAAAPKGMHKAGTGQAQAVQAATSDAINKAVTSQGRRLSSAYAPAPKPKGTNVPKVISAAPKGMKSGGTGQAQAVQAATSDAINKAASNPGRKLSSAYAPAPKPKGTNVPKVIAAAPKGMKSGGTGQAQAVQARTSAAINKAVDNAGRRLSSAYAPAPKPKGTNVPKVISAAPKGMKTGGTGQAQAVQARTSDAINKAVDKAGRRL